MNKLYRVYSTVSEFQFAGRDFYGIRVTWFVKDREKQIMPYERIAEYSKEDSYIQAVSLDEYFTFPEALALSNYLFEERDFESQIVIAKHTICTYTLPLFDRLEPDDLDCSEGIIKLSESKNYKLPLTVWGYFCLHGPETYSAESTKDAKKSDSGHWVAKQYFRRIK